MKKNQTTRAARRALASWPGCRSLTQTVARTVRFRTTEKCEGCNAQGTIPDAGSVVPRLVSDLVRRYSYREGCHRLPVSALRPEAVTRSSARCVREWGVLSRNGWPVPGSDRPPAPLNGVARSHCRSNAIVYTSAVKQSVVLAGLRAIAHTENGRNRLAGDLCAESPNRKNRLHLFEGREMFKAIMCWNAPRCAPAGA